MPTPYTGNPSAVETPASAPAPGTAIIVNLPVDADAFNSAAFYQAYKVLADNGTALFGPYYAPGHFGDGSDGSLTFDGSATVLGLVPSTGVYTATRDIYANNCTVTGASTVLYMGPYRLYVKGTLTTSGGAKVSAKGNDGVLAGAGGAAVSDATVGGSVAGGASGTNPGANVTSAFGGVGGGGSGGAAGSNGGTVTAPAATLGTPRSFNPLGQLVGGGAVGIIRGGSGGGGGQGGVGGGGGAGGGVLAIAARTLSLASAGDLTAAGGKGGDANPSNSGGGGGGGGGVLIIQYGSKNAVTFSAATNCPGGAGGAKTGGGVAGQAGANGTVYELAMA